MKILEISIRHFGRFHHAGFQFGPHINIIYGKNGSGKSTLHAFIQAMLFGMERGRGRAAHADVYSRYLPWESSGDYGGALRLEQAPGADLRETVFTRCAQEGLPLLELRRNAITLEDLFLQLTADDAQQTRPEEESVPDTPEEADGETEEDLP